eukprot:1576637-Amphidinium_carterae.1
METQIHPNHGAAAPSLVLLSGCSLAIIVGSRTLLGLQVVWCCSHWPGFGRYENGDIRLTIAKRLIGRLHCKHHVRA